MHQVRGKVFVIQLISPFLFLFFVPNYLDRKILSRFFSLPIICMTYLYKHSSAHVSQANEIRLVKLRGLLPMEEINNDKYFLIRDKQERNSYTGWGWNKNSTKYRNNVQPNSAMQKNQLKIISHLVWFIHWIKSRMVDQETNK